MSPTQRVSGNVLEYAVAVQTASEVGAPLADTSPARTAQRDFMAQSIDERRRLMHIAGQAVRHILTLEEGKLKLADKCTVIMQQDSAGQEGDPRDIILPLKKGELGISVKRNNDVSKNPRLQRNNTNFCKMWGLDCKVSAEYNQSIGDVFQHIDRAIENGAKVWTNITDLHPEVYAKIISAFAKEFFSLAKPEVCKNFTRYMLGAPDYYKLMIYEQKERAIVQGFNFGGTMSCPKLKYPERLLSVDITGDNKLLLSFEHGWVYSMRIHTAITKIENSLKWDVRMLAHPAELYSHHIISPPSSKRS